MVTVENWETVESVETVIIVKTTETMETLGNVKFVENCGNLLAGKVSQDSDWQFEKTQN